MVKPDKRYQRTHKQLLKVFMDMVLEMDFKEITVSEVSRRADINRKTFYRHFDSIYSVLDELQEDIMGDLSGLHELFALPPSLEHYRNIVKRFLQILDRNKALHKRLFCSGEYRFVFEKIRSTMTKRLDLSVVSSKASDKNTQHLYIDFLSYGFLFVVGDWLSSEKPMPEREFIENTARIMYFSAKGFLEETEQDAALHTRR